MRSVLGIPCVCKCVVFRGRGGTEPEGELLGDLRDQEPQPEHTDLPLYGVLGELRASGNLQLWFYDLRKDTVAQRQLRGED